MSRYLATRESVAIREHGCETCNDALRVLSKRVLRDQWRAARDYHTTPTN